MEFCKTNDCALTICIYRFVKYMSSLKTEIQEYLISESQKYEDRDSYVNDMLFDPKIMDEMLAPKANEIWDTSFPEDLELQTLYEKLVSDIINYYLLKWISEIT